MSDPAGDQLPLGLSLRDGATFDNYFPGGNAAAVHAVADTAEPVVFLWGAAGAGKSHLLQAACHTEAGGGGAPVYLPLSEVINGSPEWFEGLEAHSLVAVDDAERIAGDRDWEVALFDLFNRARDSGTRLRLAGTAPPAAMGIELPDLVSRLAWGPVFQLHSLDDGEKVQALQMRARNRGMVISDEVAAWLLRHYRRDSGALFALLDRLDHASLVAKRRLTIPFVREVLGR